MVKIFHKSVDVNTSTNTPKDVKLFEEEINKWIEGQGSKAVICSISISTSVNDRNDTLECIAIVNYSMIEGPIVDGVKQAEE